MSNIWPGPRWTKVVVLANGVRMWGRGVDAIDRELAQLAEVRADVRRRGQAATYAIDGLLDERLMVCSFSTDLTTEEIAAVQLPDPTSR